MALDYKQSAQLRSNLIFQGRIATALLKWGDYIVGNSAADLTKAQTRREINVSERVFASPNQEAQMIQPVVVADGAIQAGDLTSEGDSTVSDTVLQTAVETALQKVI